MLITQESANAQAWLATFCLRSECAREYTSYRCLVAYVPAPHRYNGGQQ